MLFNKIILVVVSIMFGWESGEKQADFKVDSIILGNMLDAVAEVRFKEAETM